MTGLLRVTARAADVTTELLLPAAVPLAELVPDLARSVGLLDAVTACTGYRVESPPGRCLGLDAGLAAQGVDEGATIVVRPGLGDQPRSAYADVLSLPRRGRLSRFGPPSVRRHGRSRRRAGGWPGAARRTPSGRGARAP
jgi:hypothetical protein